MPQKSWPSWRGTRGLKSGPTITALGSDKEHSGEAKRRGTCRQNGSTNLLVIRQTSATPGFANLLGKVTPHILCSLDELNGLCTIEALVAVNDCVPQGP